MDSILIKMDKEYFNKLKTDENLMVSKSERKPRIVLMEKTVHMEKMNTILSDHIKF